MATQIVIAGFPGTDGVGPTVGVACNHIGKRDSVNGIISCRGCGEVLNSGIILSSGGESPAKKIDKSLGGEDGTGGGWVNEVSHDNIAATFKRDLTKAMESRKLDKSHGGYTVLVPCDKVRGGHHYQAVGIPDPKEITCGHTFVRQFPGDGLVCTNPECGLVLSDMMLDALGPNRYDRERMRLSDECGKLKRDNDELLRENAMLRRRVEKLQR